MNGSIKEGMDQAVRAIALRKEFLATRELR
jgi:hypothetical protein